MKRTISMTLVLMTLTAFLPSAFFPSARALEAIAPETIAIGEVGGSAALPAAGILALYEVLLGGLKAAGLEFADINGVSALVPNENLGNTIATAMPMLYNGLSAADKALVWAKAQAVAAGESVVSFTSSLANMLKSLFKTQNPAQSETLVYDTVTEAYYTAFNQGGVKWHDFGLAYRLPLAPKNYPDRRYYSFIPISSPLISYDNNGVMTSVALNYPGNAFGLLLGNWDDPNSTMFYICSFTVFALNSFGNYVYEAIFGDSNNTVTRYVSPPRTYTDKSPTRPALPDEFNMNLPSYPAGATPLDTIGNMGGAVGEQDYPELVPAFPWELDPIWDEIDEIFKRIKRNKPEPPSDPPDLGWVVLAMLEVVIRDLVERNYVTTEDDRGLVELLEDVDDDIEHGRDPSVPINTISKKITGEISPGIDPQTYPPGTFPEVPPASLPTAPPTSEPGLPESPGEIDWSPLKGGFGALKLLFPFCLPFDLVRMIKSFGVSEVEPVLNLSLPFFVFVNGQLLLMPDQLELNIDLTWLSPIMPLFRFFMLTMFLFSLIKLTSKLIKW